MCPLVTLTSFLIFSCGLKVTNSFDDSLLKFFGDLVLGFACAKQILPCSVVAVKTCQSLKVPLDIGLLAKVFDVNKTIIDSSLVKEFNLSEIEIIINNDEFDKEKILDTENSIKNNGFEDTALKYSISTTSFKKGNLGWINSKSLSNQIFKVVSDMQIAEVSKPIKQQNSVLFLKLNNVRNINVKNNQLNLAKIKQNIINQKKNNLFDLYSKSHLSKLRNTSLISYK